jgi:hypothetical protein
MIADVVHGSSERVSKRGDNAADAPRLPTGRQPHGDRAKLNIVIVELIVVGVVALGLGFWQLYDVNRELRKDRERNDSGNEHRNDDRDRDRTDADAADDGVD